MKKAILIGLAFASVITACKKDHNDFSVQRQGVLAKVISHDSSYSKEFMYGNNALIQVKKYEWGDTTNTFLNYMNGKVLTIGQGNNMDQLLVYDKGGRVLESVRSDGNLFDSMTYNNNGTIQKIFTFFISGHIALYVRRFTWTTNGNVASVTTAQDEASLENDWNYLLTYSYDSNLNPYQTFSPFYNIGVESMPGYMSRNNTVREVLQSVFPGSAPQTRVREFSYAYNDYGYPVKCAINVKATQEGPVIQTTNLTMEYLTK